MSETYSGDIPADEIDTPDTPSAALDREAAALLHDDARGTFASPQPLRQAVREDAAAAREWGRARVGRFRRTVETAPLKTTAYALAIGVVIGLLAAR